MNFSSSITKKFVIDDISVSNVRVNIKSRCRKNHLSVQDVVSSQKEYTADILEIFMILWPLEKQ